MPANPVLRVEGLLAQAHRAVAKARFETENWVDQGMTEDLKLLEDELYRLTLDLLGGQRPRRAAARHSAYPNTLLDIKHAEPSRSSRSPR